MSEMSARNIIRIDDLDQSIFRIYSQERFLAILAEGMDSLRNPSTWDDPFENFFLRRTQVALNPGLADLESLARDWYGQCWTINSNTDAMWRIYSPGNHGIQLKTTIRKLFANLMTTVPSANPELQFFVGRVSYMSEAQIRASMAEVTFYDVAIGSQGEGFADLLCIKREAFQHEAELRILFQDIVPLRGANGTVVYPLDANVIFDQIVLDPRLEDAEADVLKKRLVAAGCQIPIEQSDLYKAPHFIIPAQ